MVDRATIERILDTARIEEVVGDFVSLKRRGANFVACCPFHQVFPSPLQKESSNASVAEKPEVLSHS